MAYRRSALVTGGAGFIGSHLVDRLVAEGYRVVIVDDLTTGKLKNLNHDAVFHHMSITRPTLREVMNREKPDLVFHLAAQSSVPRSVKDPILDNEINVLGTLRLLEGIPPGRRGKSDLFLDGRRALRRAGGRALSRRCASHSHLPVRDVQVHGRAVPGLLLAAIPPELHHPPLR